MQKKRSDIREKESFSYLAASQKNILLSLSRDITSCSSKEAILDIINNQLAQFFKYNAVSLSVLHNNGINHSNFLCSLPEAMLHQPDFPAVVTDEYKVADGVYDILLASAAAVTFDLEKLIKRKKVPGYIDFFYKNGIRELIAFPLRINDRNIGNLSLYTKNKNAFTKTQIYFIETICSYISIALSNILAYQKIENQLEEINHYRSKLEGENLYLVEQMKTAYKPGDIIGSGNSMKEVFDLVYRVATSDTTVLLQGETGTGKELIARAIHNLSGRKDKLMIKINCAALPANLIESELFGHEKGSFTGASDKRIGKFELAHNSTLFLDEIGEMPLEMQVKFLRALQEKEIERVGGNSIIKTDVRLIAATNRNLQQEVAAGRFRKDLYYRLDVFPIILPALRSRKEDIPELALHFIQQISKRFGKNINNISKKVMEQLMKYSWPGNIRELEHLMERSILMTDGNTIRKVYLPPNNNEKLAPQKDAAVKTIDEIEREHILAVLEKANGRVRGTNGAAAFLQIPPTTLHSKMKRLGIMKGAK